MAYIPIGKIRPTGRGQHSASLPYEVLDVVMSQDGTAAYIALKDVPAGTSLGDASYWSPLLDVAGKLTELAESYAADAAAAAAPFAAAAATSAEAAAASAEAAAEVVQSAIDDEEVSAQRVWSSAKVLDALCPPMEVSGNPVTCYPVAGSPLNVSARVEPVQHLDWMKREGQTTQDGTPSPDAPVPLVDSVPAGSYYVPSTAPDGGYWRVDLDAALGGVSGYNDALEIDAYTGRYRVVRNTALSVLVGSETVNKYNTSSGILFRISGDYGLEADSGRMACTHYVVTSGTGRRDKTLSVSARLVAVDIIDNDFNDTPSFLNYIAAQHAAGTSVTIRYALAAPIITTGQAASVTSADGLTALNAVSMGLTAPDPEHPCEITVADAVQITRNGDTYNVALPEGFAGGEVDVTGGDMRGLWRRRALLGTENIVRVRKEEAYRFVVRDAIAGCMAYGASSIAGNCLCSAYAPGNSVVGSNTINYAVTPWNDGNLYIRDDRFETAEAYKAWLAAQHAAGDTVTVYYKLAAPAESETAPTPISALPGCNALSGTAQGLTVRGHADPIHIIAGLAQRISALEGAGSN